LNSRNWRRKMKKTMFEKTAERREKMIESK